jgi:signal transduction histidine kinase/chemotaxis response regulator CheB/HPt (histidine-containing phosphotransfer) domain-containing protein
MTEHAVTILVVEDSPTQALRLQITLEQQGWTTLWSASAEEALERLNDELPDLVLVDLHLPGISGDEFTRRVRMNMRTRSLPMLMLTDSDSVESQRRGFESGADDYVPKSSASDVLLLRISNLLRSTAGSLPASSPAADFRRSRTLVAVDVLAVGESQAAVADRLAVHLKQDGHDITVVASKASAVAKLEAAPYDCVVILLSDDVEESLKFCSSLDLLRRKQGEPFQIIAVDGSSGLHEVLRVLQSGADDFVDARDGLQILSARIGAHLRRRSMQEESLRLAAEDLARRQELERAQQVARTAEARAALADALEESNAKLRDIQAQLTEARDNAEQAARAKTDFLATMSHEIRTPMTGVLGMADLLAAEALTPTQRHYVETIRRSGSHLLSIINDILDFSRIEAGRLDLELIDFAPMTALDHVVSLLQTQATERGLMLRQQVKVSSGLVVRGDPTRVRQVLVNLVGNALKFTAAGEVVVGVEERLADPERVQLRFTVQDTGIGIPAERQAALFSAFVQADRSTNRHYGGSGLGLAICKRLVEAMGGTIGVESQEGVGSLFWFELPFRPGSGERMAELGSAVAEQIRPLHILVADDVAVNRELVGTMLRRHGHEVDLAENGVEAVERAGRGGYDVVLMDVQMPVMDGIEAARRIRQLPAPTSAVPILALTANVMASERERYLAAGMNRCLVKPIVWNELFGALAAIASGTVPPEDRTEPSAQPGAVDLLKQPLIERGRVDDMAQKMGPQLVRQMLDRGLNGAGESLQRLCAAGGDLEAVAREAHRLRGTSGTFGLARISALAGLIEDAAASGPAARRDEIVAELVGLLGTVLDETRWAAEEAFAGAGAG